MTTTAFCYCYPSAAAAASASRMTASDNHSLARSYPRSYPSAPNPPQVEELRRTGADLERERAESRQQVRSHMQTVGPIFGKFWPIGRTADF